MKLFMVLCFVALFLCNCKNGQKKTNLDIVTARARIQELQDESKKMWEANDYQRALDLLKEAHSLYESLDEAVKKNFPVELGWYYYRHSTGYAKLNQTDSALWYLQKAVDLGYSNYEYLVRDSDLVNIRNEPKYLAVVEQLKKVGSFEDILKKAATYKAEAMPIPEFAYQPIYAEKLTQLWKKYKLDSIAGKGDEISQIIRLMQWVHREVRHDGQAMTRGDCSADGLIQLCKKENRGVNCRMLATILNEVYLAMGFRAQFVTCLPRSKTDSDCHVINHVFSKTLNKWLWMDTSFEAWVTDEKGTMLSIPEVRERLIKGLPVKTPSSMNWNGKPRDGYDYLHSYMAKNLYQISIPKVSTSAYEKTNWSKRTYVQLISSEYQKEFPELNGLKERVYYTTDVAQFWANPK